MGQWIFFFFFLYRGGEVGGEAAVFEGGGSEVGLREG